MKDATHLNIKINNTREIIKNSTLHDDSKELLYTLLDTAAESANGTPDKLKAIGDTLLAFCLYEIRSSVRFPEQLNQSIENAVKKHADSCPLRNATINMPKIAIWLMPFKWPLCILGSIMLFAPNASAIITSVIKIWK
jgi:hypothetical protein